jgi:hypothetical protein
VRQISKKSVEKLSLKTRKKGIFRQSRCVRFSKMAGILRIWKDDSKMLNFAAIAEF